MAKKTSKADLIEALTKKVKCSKKASGECLNALLDEVKASLKKGQDVVLTGFGTFRVSKRKARIGRNPQTGKSIKIPAKKVPVFKAGKDLKKAVK
jgi:DNA-binding protein HU-beta